MLFSLSATYDFKITFLFSAKDKREMRKAELVKSQRKITRKKWKSTLHCFYKRTNTHNFSANQKSLKNRNKILFKMKTSPKRCNRWVKVISWPNSVWNLTKKDVVLHFIRKTLLITSVNTGAGKRLSNYPKDSARISFVYSWGFVMWFWGYILPTFARRALERYHQSKRFENLLFLWGIRHLFIFMW